MKNIYELRDIKFSYGEHPALDIKSLDIPDSGIVGLVGPNGSGKSTLLKMLACLLSPSSGKIFFEGEDAAGHERDARLRVTMLLQDHYLLRTSVKKNIEYGLKLRGITGAPSDALVRESMSRVGLSYEGFAGRMWYRLSGGEAQRVSLAARLAIRPKVLILDEPTANVDGASAAKIKEAIISARDDHGSTIIVATHDLPWLYEAATEIVGMYEGRATSGAANLLPGDWMNEGGTAALVIRDMIFRAEISHETTLTNCAAVAPSDIKISTGEEAESHTPRTTNRMHGMVTQMTLERSTGNIIVAVGRGGLTFRVRINGEEAAQKNIRPGATVNLSFPISSVKFI